MAALKVAVLKVIMAQVNPLVGDVPGNTALVIEQATRALQQFEGRVVVFPELTLTGYPPEDLLLRPSIRNRIETALRSLCDANLDIYMVVGYPRLVGDQLFNMAGVIYRGKLLVEYAKQHLPNYQVFDEKRYFQTGSQSAVFQVDGITCALTICEDIWQDGPMQAASDAGGQLMLNLNASPFHRGKLDDRRRLLVDRVAEGRMPIVYVNQVGAQDELVFDGGSMAMDAQGELKVQAPHFESGLIPVEVEIQEGETQEEKVTGIKPGQFVPDLSRLESVYQALVLGVRDYVNKNRFKGVVLGLSGGIDSALTLAVAVDALGAERVEAVMMPFRYTAEMSIEDAAEEAKILGVNYRSISIEPMYDAFMEGLTEEFAGTERDVTEQNIQARCRGVLLMSISNKKGVLVLTTGNKSEIAVGYSTLYGDMAGGFDVLKDVPKTLVFKLASYRNTVSPVIPQRVIDRPPSAELAPDQKDEDSLPPYDLLDEILELYVEQDYSARAIISAGYDEETVHRILRLVDLNEYKRRQAPIGVRITQRGFGRDRRYPITTGWLLGD